jgi:hypothetical protein
MSLIGVGTPPLTGSDLIEYSKTDERDDVVDLAIAGLVEVGSYTPSTTTIPADDDSGALAWLINDMNASIRAARDDDLLIYVHGAKVNFYNANAFAAQLDHFMGRDMTSMAFSWPTRQNIVAYGGGGDVRRAYRAAPALTSLIEELAKRTVARRIHIVCWSAGGRVVTAALQELYDRHSDSGDDLRERFRLGTVYYAAADVPAEEFLEALPAVDAVSTRVVVTVSSQDDALNMAQKFMGGGTRIGLRNQDLSQEELDVLHRRQIGLGLARATRPGDLVLIGAPSVGPVVPLVGDTIPALLARGGRTPVMVVRDVEQKRALRFERVFFLGGERNSANT